MPLAPPGVRIRCKLYLFCLVIFIYHFGVLSGVGGARDSQHSNRVTPGGPERSSREKASTQSLPPGRQGTREDIFHETKPKSTSSEQWAAWKKRYGFAPLGEFCDDCRRVPGKCRYLQACQDYCAEDCYGHGKDITVNILCDWCNGARDARCKHWRSCREHCGLLCLHERYKLKVEADLRKENEERQKLQTQLYKKYLRKREEEERAWVERQTILRKKQLGETRKRLAKLAELEYRPVETDL